MRAEPVQAEKAPLRNAWTILLVLTFARMSMGVQFQAIPALAGPLTTEQGMSFVGVGTLTGAYLLPGAVIALAGGWLGQRVGAARVALFGLAMMTLGGFGGWWVSQFEWALAWRLVAGIGAVALNVMGTKMVADWFEGRPDLPTAMGVFVSSWPAGIALAALVLPAVSAQFGLGAALLGPVVMCGLGWVGLVLIWQEPRPALAKPVTSVASFSKRELLLVTLAGGIWAIYNVALIGAIAWIPGLLVESGLSLVAASAAVSLVGWAAIISVASGGWLARITGAPNAMASGCFFVSALIVCLLPTLGQFAGSVWVMIALGLAVGPAAALVMTLPVIATRVEVRAKAMGLYFAIYYALMGLGPAALGLTRDMSGLAQAPLYLASGLFLLALALWWLFQSVHKGSDRSTASPG